MEQIQLFAGLDLHTEFIIGTIKDDAGKVETLKAGVKKFFERKGWIRKR